MDISQTPLHQILRVQLIHEIYFEWYRIRTHVPSRILLNSRPPLIPNTLTYNLDEQLLILTPSILLFKQSKFSLFEVGRDP